MVWLLLDFIRGDRLSHWNLHLEAFNDILIYDAAFGHLNYLRWGTVYMADMKMLPHTAPEVQKAFTDDGVHTISRAPTTSKFIAVSPDMALEQTQNRDAKSKGGIVGISKEDESQGRWSLTAHLMAAVTNSVKSMCDMVVLEQIPKDPRSTQIETDWTDVTKLKKCIKDIMVHPFDTSKYDGERLPLVNIATGVVAPSDVASSLLGAYDLGTKVRDKFIDDRLVKGTKIFWDPMKKSNVKTFASLRKPLKFKKEKQMATAVNIDREIFSRLVVVSEKRDINLKEVIHMN